MIHNQIVTWTAFAILAMFVKEVSLSAKVQNAQTCKSAKEVFPKCKNVQYAKGQKKSSPSAKMFKHAKGQRSLPQGPATSSKCKQRISAVHSVTVQTNSNFKIDKKNHLEHYFNACGNLFVIILPSIISSNSSASSPHSRFSSPADFSLSLHCTMQAATTKCTMQVAQVRLLASNKAGLDTHTRENTHFLPMTVSLIPRIVSARSYPTLMLTFYDSAEERKGAYGQICCWWSTSVILRGLTCTRFCIWASRALCVMCGCIVNVHTLGCVGQCIL